MIDRLDRAGVLRQLGDELLQARSRGKVMLGQLLLRLSRGTLVVMDDTIAVGRKEPLQRVANKNDPTADLAQYDQGLIEVARRQRGLGFIRRKPPDSSGPPLPLNGHCRIAKGRTFGDATMLHFGRS
nr:hypothetical protein [Paracoccus litorisediminis]